MQQKEQGEICWLEFDLFAQFKRLKHGVFLRKGGFSKGTFAALNLSSEVGDNDHCVQSNRALVASIIECPHLIYTKQCHGVEIAPIENINSQNIPSCDALMTHLSNVGLMINHADCQAAIFYDPIHHAVTNVHCGWRGNVQNIYAKTVDKMRQRYGSKPKDLLVGIGPSLGPQVSEFINYQREFPEVFWEFQVKPYYFDLWAISEMQLKECGILPKNLEIAKRCTYSDSDYCYSYRRDKIKGGHGTIVMLKS